MNIEKELDELLVKEEYLEIAKQAKEYENFDYCRGFDDGATWLRNFVIERSTECRIK